MYNIKTISALTGLGAETLRAWERRYETIMPSRDDNGRRFYSQQDLERLTLLANLTRQGHAISKLSTLNDTQLLNLSKQGQQDEHAPQQALLVQIIDNLKNYQIDRCEQLLKRALVAHEPLVYARDILLPALQEVGNLWHRGEISVAQEHLFSACVKRIVLSMVNNVHSLREGRPAMLFTAPSAEVHEFGLLVSCLLAATQHYNCYYLGGNLPGEDIAEAVKYLKPDIVVLSLVITPPAAETLAELPKLHQTLQGVEVWSGGSGAQYLQQQQQLPAGWQLLNDIEQFNQRAVQWLQAQTT